MKIEYLLMNPNYKKIDSKEHAVTVKYLIKYIEMYPEVFDADQEKLKSICDFCNTINKNSKCIIYQTKGCVCGCCPSKIELYTKSVKKIAVIYDI